MKKKKRINSIVENGVMLIHLEGYESKYLQRYAKCNKSNEKFHKIVNIHKK